MCWRGGSSTGLLWAQLRQIWPNWISLSEVLYPGCLNGMVVQGSMRANPSGKCLLNTYLWPVHDVPLAKSSYYGSASVWEGTIGYQEVITLEVTQFSSVQSLSSVQLFETPWIAACQASLSITNSQRSLKLMSNFQWVASSHQVAKELEFQLYHHSFQRTPSADLL